MEETLNIKFEEPDNFAHGYHEYRSQFGNAWIWLSPNLVPNGFVRENEVGYEELIKLAEGTASRFPEIPATNLLISFSDEHTKDIVVAKLRDHQLEIKSLEEIIGERN